MPSLRGHMVFMSVLQDALRNARAALAADVERHWPVALLGSQGPDAWFFSGQKRSETHGLDQGDHTTWADALTRWLDQHPEIGPGRAQPPHVRAFIAGYLSHLGLDTWEQYQHEEFPADRRAQAPTSWYPELLESHQRVRAALRRLGEAPFPVDRLVTAEQLQEGVVLAQFHPEAVKRVTIGIVPSLPLRDAWEISRISPLREMPRTEEARRAWEQERAARAEATLEEYQALLDAATAFTLAAVDQWW
ncbi:MAG TPA: hypothetical protein VGW38_29520 [Chloroflexota bacterium]|nr:hypothetical protein [Chloroflexota bacterium]